MADKTSTTNTIQLVAEFADGDTRIINVENPKDVDMTVSSNIYELQTFLQENSIIIGDKNGAAFSRFSQANMIEKTQTIFDLG